MIFRQITHDDLGCASYLIGDEDAGVAAVVDPKLDIEEYLALARYMGVRIEHILETHNHADHVSGHGRLAAATGAAIHVHRDAAPDYDHEPFDDGWELALGCVRVRALHTPGHRPEHTAFALVDTARGPEPWAVLTGDTLFVGDIARPDLAVDKREGAQGIFRSLHDKLLDAARPTCEVWPGHLGGSLCGGPGMDMKVSSTIGYERAHNELLGEDRRGRVRASARPPRSARSRRTSRRSSRSTAARCTRGRVASSRSPRARSRPSSATARWSSTSGPTCSSTTPTSPAPSATRRSAPASAPSWRGSPTATARSCSSAATTTTRVRAAHLAAAVGITNLGGYLAGGMTSWREEKRPTERDRAHRRRRAARARATTLQVLDVREQAEWDAGHIAGSVHTPYHDIDAIPDGHRPASGRSPSICSSGQRSAVAASLLRRHGAREVIHVAGGGVGTWARQGWPLEPRARREGRPLVALAAIPFGLGIGLCVGHARRRRLGAGRPDPRLRARPGRARGDDRVAGRSSPPARWRAASARPGRPRVLAPRGGVHGGRAARRRRRDGARPGGRRRRADRGVRRRHARRRRRDVAQGRRADGEDGADAPCGACPPLILRRDLAAGLLIGALTGFFGVGGGFLIVPTLAIALALSMRLAVGTSLAIMTATSVHGAGRAPGRRPRHRRRRDGGDDRRVRGRRARRRSGRRPDPAAPPRARLRGARHGDRRVPAGLRGVPRRAADGVVSAGGARPTGSRPAGAR